MPKAKKLILKKILGLAKLKKWTKVKNSGKNYYDMVININES